MANRKKRKTRRHGASRRKRISQRRQRKTGGNPGAELPFAHYFREVEANTHPAEMPWGGDSTMIEGWFAAGEDLDEIVEHDPMEWPREGSLARAWTWMCSAVLPAEKTNPEVGQSDS